MPLPPLKSAVLRVLSSSVCSSSLLHQFSPCSFSILSSSTVSFTRTSTSCLASSNLSSCGLYNRRGFATKPRSDPSKKKASTDSSKKKKRAFRRVTLVGGFDVKTAIRLAKATARHHFDETVEMAFNLGLDVRKPDQSVRSVTTLPHGTGKKEAIAVFATGEKAEEARKAGALIVGGKELADEIAAGKIEFTKCFATPDMMPIVARVARVLGPRGLMPNPKSGTMVVDIGPAVKAATKGQVQFRTDKHGVVHTSIGKLSFSDQELEENLETFVKALEESKPPGARGMFIRGAFICTTHGQSVQLDLRLPPFGKGAAQTRASSIVQLARKEGLLHYARLQTEHSKQAQQEPSAS
eukprot:g53991.t1